jgi:hypothetical protein
MAKVKDTVTVDDAQAIDIEAVHANGVDHGAAPGDDDDFFDPERLRLHQEFADDFAVKVILTVPVRKPRPQSFFRVNPDPAYRLPTLLLELKDERESYLIERGLIAQLTDEIVPVILFTVIDRQENLSLWPARVPSQDGRKSEWHTSAMRIAQMAMEKWVRMHSNMGNGCYEASEAVSKLPEPRWPEITFKEILKAAFKDRFLTDINHPVLKKLRGEI